MGLSRWTGRHLGRPCCHLDLHVAPGGALDADLLPAGQPVLTQGHPVLHAAVLQEGGVGGAGRDAPISGHDVAPTHPHCCGGRGRQQHSPPHPGSQNCPLPQMALFRERGQLGQQDATSRASPATPAPGPPTLQGSRPSWYPTLRSETHRCLTEGGFPTSSRNPGSAVDLLPHRVQARGPQGEHPNPDSKGASGRKNPQCKEAGLTQRSVFV